MTTVGKCLCGQIKISVPTETLNSPKNAIICHCKNCCRCTGSLGTINLFVPDPNVQIEGELKVYNDGDTDSGVPVQRFFCGNCGSPIYSATTNISGVKIVKLALFDEIPEPGMEVYCKSMPSWNKPMDGTKQFDGMPTK